MTLFAEPNLTSGIDDALVSTAQSVTIFPIMALIFVFTLVFLGGSANQKRRVGTADYPFWSVLAGLATTFLSLLFTLREGVINIVTLSIVVAITVLCSVWFFLSKVRGEQ